MEQVNQVSKEKSDIKALMLEVSLSLKNKNFF